MKRLKSMRVAPSELHVHRVGRWIKALSDEIYPGEIVLIKKYKDKKSMVPCDLLIISGSAVVNEAILTGESQPLVKEGVASKDDPDE
jgi:manganese-transporting P-type ATPase